MVAILLSLFASITSFNCFGRVVHTAVTHVEQDVVYENSLVDIEARALVCVTVTEYGADFGASSVDVCKDDKNIVARKKYYGFSEPLVQRQDYSTLDSIKYYAMYLLGLRAPVLLMPDEVPQMVKEHQVADVVCWVLVAEVAARTSFPEFGWRDRNDRLNRGNRGGAAVASKASHSIYDRSTAYQMVIALP